MGCDLKKGERPDASTDLSLKKFNLSSVIGRGGFGKVWKIENKKTKKEYALKQISKSRVISKKSVASVLNQRQLLQCLYHPFLINIMYAFQNRQNLYLVMDLVNGGDLRYHLIKHSKFNEQQTKFFVANILLGLQYLHMNGILHRDIKPQNLVFQMKGYLRITDLGIARIWKPENATDTSGTPGYMAPEVMCRSNHGVAVDYYAVGIIVYQCMYGRRPYYGKNRQEIRDQILAKQIQIKKSDVPYNWSNQSADFCNKLIQRKPQNRLGFNGPDEVKNHPWFKNFNWEKLYRKELPSPFIPQYDSEEYQQQFLKNEDVIDPNTNMLLRRQSIQNLFKEYEFDGTNIKNPIFEAVSRPHTAQP